MTVSDYKNCRHAQQIQNTCKEGTEKMVKLIFILFTLFALSAALPAKEDGKFIKLLNYSYFSILIG